MHEAAESAEPQVKAHPKQIYFGKDIPLTAEQINEIISRPLMRIETNILWREQLNRELSDSECEFMHEIARGWATGREIKRLARFMDITPKRLKKILKG
jgi:hypothetical protein